MTEGNIVETIKVEAVAAIDNVLSVLNSFEARLAAGADSIEAYLEEIRSSLVTEKSKFEDKVVSLQAPKSE